MELSQTRVCGQRTRRPTAESFPRLALTHPFGLSRPSGVLGDRGIHIEIQRLAAIAWQAPVAGFYTYGEIARTRGMRGFHNQTLVVLSIS
jgi:hypothetical protein